MSAFDRWAETARKASRGERTDTVRLARQTFNEMKSDRNFQWLKKYIERRLPTAEIHASPGGNAGHQSSSLPGQASSSSSLGFLDQDTVYYLLVLCDPTDIPTRLLRIVQMLENEVGRISIEIAGLLLLSTIAGKCGSLGDFVSAFEHQLRKLLIIVLENRKKLPQINTTRRRKRHSSPPKRRNTRAGTVVSVTSRDSYGAQSGTFAIAGSGSSFMNPPGQARSPPLSPVSNSMGTVGVLPLALGTSNSVKSRAAKTASRAEDLQPLPQSKSWVVEQLGLQREAMLNAHSHEDPYLTSPGTSNYGSFGGPTGGGGTTIFPIGRQGGGLAVDNSYTPDDHALGAPSRPHFDMIDPMRTAGVLSDCESTGTVGTEAAATGGAFRSAGISAPAATMREALILLIALVAKQNEGPAEKLLEQAREHVPEFPDPMEESEAMVTISLSFTLIHGVASFLDVQGQNWEIRSDHQTSGMRRGSYHAPPPLAPASPGDFLSSASAGDFSRSRGLSIHEATQENFLLTSSAVKRLFNLNGDGEPASARGAASPLVPTPEFARGTKVLNSMGGSSSPINTGSTIEVPAPLARTRARQNSEPNLKVSNSSLGVPSGRRGSMLPPPFPSKDSDTTDESSIASPDQGSPTLAEGPKEQDQPAATVAIDFTAFSGESSQRNSVADPLFDSSRALAAADVKRESVRKESVVSEGTAPPTQTQESTNRLGHQTEDDFSDREEGTDGSQMESNRTKAEDIGYNDNSKYKSNGSTPVVYDDEDHSPTKLPPQGSESEPSPADNSTAAHRAAPSRRPVEDRGCGACCTLM